jgi:hypothetical protein
MYSILSTGVNGIIPLGVRQRVSRDEFRQPKRLLRGDRGLQPGAIALVVRGTVVERIDQDIDVRQDQDAVPSIRSSRAALSSRSIPGRRSDHLPFP